MRTLEDMFREEYGSYTMIDVDAMLNTQSPVEKVFAENKPTVQAVPQNTLQKTLEEAGIGLENAAKFLEGLGSVNIGGIDFTLRDLLPVDEETSKALKTAGSGMPLTTGSGVLNTKFKPEFTGAAGEIALATAGGKAIQKGVSKLAKSVMKNKAKIATGAATLAGASATKEKAK